MHLEPHTYLPLTNYMNRCLFKCKELASTSVISHLSFRLRHQFFQIILHYRTTVTDRARCMMGRVALNEGLATHRQPVPNRVICKPIPVPKMSCIIYRRLRAMSFPVAGSFLRRTVASKPLQLLCGTAQRPRTHALRP